MKKRKLNRYEVESPNKAKFELKKYQKIILLVLGILLIIATIILLVMFRQYIFASQTWTIIAMLAVILLIIGISMLGYWLLNGKER